MQVTLPTGAIGGELVASDEEQGQAIDAASQVAADDLVHVARAQRDIRDFAPLYETYAPLVYGYCLRRLSHPDNAADAAALVFTRAIAALPRFRPDKTRSGSTFRAWLFTIAHNVVVDAHRRKREQVSLDLHHDALAAAGRLLDASASPEDIAVANDAASTVHRHLRALPERQRAIVELRLAGLSGNEISRTLGMSESAVKSAQFRAYATLRTLLQPNTPDPRPEKSR